MLKRHIPQEIQDYVIDFFIESLPKATNKEALQLRLVSRTWISRADLHAFRTIQMEISEGPTLLSLIKSSNFVIGSRIRRLSVDGNASFTHPSLFSYHNKEIALQEYLRDIIKYLPSLDSLKMTWLCIAQVCWMPRFSTMKNLILENVSMFSSQALGLISTATPLETLRTNCCDVYGSKSIRQHLSSSSISSSSLFLKHLKSYNTSFFSFKNSVSFDSYLFPVDVQLKLPSLSHLSLSNIDSNFMPMTVHLLRAAPRSLRLLQLFFSRTCNDVDINRQDLDLSRFEKLEFIRLGNISPYFSTETTEFNIALAALESLPNDIKDLTVSIYFSEGLNNDCRFFRRLDSLLASKPGVSAVEITLWDSGGINNMRQEDQEKLRQVFPQLLAQEKLSAVGHWSEVSQISLLD